MGAITFVKGKFAEAFVSRLAMSNDTKATVLGLVAAAILASGVDWGKAIQGDSTELGKVAGAVVTALLGHYINKPDKPKVS